MPLDQAAVEAMTRLPKVELHCHVEGTMRPATVAELAARNGIALPSDRPDRALPLRQPERLPRGSSGWCSRRSADRPTGPGWRTSRSWTPPPPVSSTGRRSSRPARHLGPGQDLADIVAGLAEGLAAGEERDRHAGHARSATWTARTAAPPGGSWSSGWSSCGGPARPGPSGSSASEWTRPSSASIRSTSPTRTDGGRGGPAPHRPPGRGQSAGRRSPSASTCSASSGSTTACPLWTIPSCPAGWPTGGSRSRSARRPTSGSPTRCSGWRTTRTGPCARRGLLATLNTDDPAMIDLDLATEYAAVAGRVLLQPRGDGRDRPGRRRGELARRDRQGPAPGPDQGGELGAPSSPPRSRRLAPPRTDHQRPEQCMIGHVGGVATQRRQRLPHVLL